MRRFRLARLTMAASLVALLLAACTVVPATPGQDRSPRHDGIGVPVDPVYGTPAPGSHPIF
ncbi:MAG TPA: hypothetical protein VN668_14905 [Stellaceae bacterium]|nr:hypothetical protein [Stellaceae bacterium]